MRLIDADALLKSSRIGKILYFDDTATGGYTDVLLAVEVEHAPTIDAEPVRHGEWILPNGSSVPVCSKCNYRTLVKPPYCAYCGAKMDGGDVCT